jgi:putative transposase
MAGPRRACIELPVGARRELRRLVAARGTPQQVALRASSILLLAEGLTNVAVGRQVGVSREVVRLWRDRRLDLQAVPAAGRRRGSENRDVGGPRRPVRPARDCRAT